MSLEVALPDPVLAFETRHVLVPIEQRKQSESIALAIAERRELMSLFRRGLHAQPAQRIDMRLELRAKPLEVDAAGLVEADDDPFVSVVGV